MSASAARQCAYRVVRRVFEQGAYADRALHAEATGLRTRDRAFATALVYGTVQRRRTLDYALSPLVSRPLGGLDPALLAALRLGAQQILLMDGVSEYAAVDQSVELVKREHPRGAKLVNAVLRRVPGEGRDALAALDDETVAGAAIVHSVPDWIAELWWNEFGAVEARALLTRINMPAETSIRLNTLLGAPGPEGAAELGARGLEVRPAPGWVDADGLPELTEGVVAAGPFDAFGSELWRDGLIMPQSRGSMAVARALAPTAGERVLDLCAAPGAKTTHLSALMGAEGELVAVEVHPRRAAALEDTCARMRAANVRVLSADGREPQGASRFDRVLVDPPCSGLGTLQIRPDLRWQTARAQLDGLARKQQQLLGAGADAVAPGGVLVYSVCTLTRAETGAVIERLLAERPQFTLERSWLLLPHREQTDGFFIARLRRRG